jgi:hypothetical protein
LPKIGPSKNCAGGLDCENVFSASILGTSSPSTVINESTSGWIAGGQCSRPATGLWKCDFKAGLFSEPPNCTTSRFIPGQTTAISAATHVTGDTTKDHVYVLAATSANTSFTLFCTKTGADFKPITEQGVVVTGQAQGALLSVYTTGQAIGNATVAYQPTIAVNQDLIAWDLVGHEGTFLKSGKFSAVFFTSAFDAGSNTSRLEVVYEIDSGSGYAVIPNTIKCSGLSFSSGRGDSFSCPPTIFRANRGDKIRVRLTGTNASAELVTDTNYRHSLNIFSVLDRQSIVGDLQGMVKVGGTTSRIETGWANFGQATDGSVCSSGACTRYRAVGNIGNNMSATRTGTGNNDITTTGWQANSYISCDLPAASIATGEPRDGWVSALGLAANSSGGATFKVFTTTNSANADAYFQVKCTGEVP